VKTARHDIAKQSPPKPKKKTGWLAPGPSCRQRSPTWLSRVGSKRPWWCHQRPPASLARGPKIRPILRFPGLKTKFFFLLNIYIIRCSVPCMRPSFVCTSWQRKGKVLWMRTRSLAWSLFLALSLRPRPLRRGLGAEKKRGGSSRQKGKEGPNSGSPVHPCSDCPAPHECGASGVLCA